MLPEGRVAEARPDSAQRGQLGDKLLGADAFDARDDRGRAHGGAVVALVAVDSRLLATRRARGNGPRRLVQGILATLALAVDGEANDLGLTARTALAVAYRLSVLARAADDDADVVLIQPRPVCNLRS